MATLDYRSRAPRSREHGRWPRIAGVVSLLIIATEIFWCAFITALSLLFITKDVQPIGWEGLLIAAMMALPLPVAAALGIYALRCSSSEPAKVSGLLGVIGALIWTVALAAWAT